MDESSAIAPSFTSKIKTTLTDPRALSYIAIALALGAASAGIGWKVYLKPLREIANIRYQSNLCLLRLYNLQQTYHGAHGTFANDIGELLASAADGAQLHDQLKASVDINTLAIVGDKDRFRLEVNILDPERTPVKLRGKLVKR